MTTLVLPVDIEELTINYLLSQSDLDAVIVSTVPTTKTFPLVRVHQFNDQQVSGPALWLLRYSLQIDVWGGPKRTVTDIARAIRAHLDPREMAGSYDEGVVTHTETFGGDTTPDPNMTSEKGNARPHARFDAYVWAHPLPDLGS